MDGFNWKRAVERYGEELAAIAAGLIVMAGIQMGRTVETLPRHLYRRILSILRPAEYAARRIIMMAACKLVPDSGLPLTNEKTNSGLPLANEEGAPKAAISSSPHRGEDTQACERSELAELVRRLWREIPPHPICQTARQSLAGQFDLSPRGRGTNPPTPALRPSPSSIRGSAMAIRG